jgi:AraC-like DNA-binding protein
MNPMPESATVARRVRVRGRDVQSLYQRGLTWVALEPIPGLACAADITMRRLPGLGLQSGLVRGNRHRHTRADVMEGNDDVSLHVNRSGVSIVSGRGAEIVLRDGDAVLFSYAEPRLVTRPGTVDHRIVRLPRASLAPLVRDIDSAMLLRIPRTTGALSLLTTYIGALIDDPALECPDIRQVVTTQLCDLVAVTVGATRDAAAIAEGRGVRVARLRAIQSDIEAHLTDGDLTPTAVARRQGISDSYIRKLFDAEGTSFSAFVLSRRLVRAHRMLLDRQRLDRSVAPIAFESGFGDLSYFNRTFKRAYGVCPSHLRDQGERS